MLSPSPSNAHFQKYEAGVEYCIVSEHLHPHTSKQLLYIGFAYQGKDIVFIFIIEYIVA
jgi:hypothetical protein